MTSRTPGCTATNYPCNDNCKVSAENSVEFHKQQNLFSQELNLKIKATVKEVIKSIEKLDIQNEVGKQALLSLRNCFVENLKTIIYRLQNFVIILNENLIGKQQLVKLVGKLVETSYSARHSFNEDSEGLKLKLINSIQDVEIVAADLLKIIENEELHETKNKLIDELSNLLRTLDCIKFHEKVLNNLTLGQIKQLFDRCANGLHAVLDVIKSDNNKIVLYHFVHSFNTACQHVQTVVHYMERYADQYGTELYQVVYAGSLQLHNILVETQELLYKSGEIKLMIDFFRENITRGCAIMEHLEILLQNKEVPDSFKEIVHTASSTCLAIANQLRRGLENSSRFMEIKQ